MVYGGSSCGEVKGRMWVCMEGVWRVHGGCVQGAWRMEGVGHPHLMVSSTLGQFDFQLFQSRLTDGLRVVKGYG